MRMIYEGGRTHTVLQFTLLMVGVEFKDIEDGLRVFGIVFTSDGRFGKELAPLLGHSL